MGFTRALRGCYADLRGFYAVFDVSKGDRSKMAVTPLARLGLGDPSGGSFPKQGYGCLGPPGCWETSTRVGSGC